MKLGHKIPCAQCPWRKTAPAGYLGGNSPELYADIVQENGATACHMKDYRGTDDPRGEERTAFCVGALQTANNSCTQVRWPRNAPEAADKVGTNDACFKWVRDFFRHHSGGEEYAPPIERLLRRMTSEKN